MYPMTKNSVTVEAAFAVEGKVNSIIYNPNVKDN